MICSLAHGQHRQLLAASAPTMAAYGRLWGWDLVISTENLAQGRPASWNKVRLVAELLERYKTVFWIDADALFVTIGRDITSELEPGRELYLAQHLQPNGLLALNTGVFIIRRSTWSRGFLERVWARLDLVQHDWWENAAILQVLGYSPNPPYGLEQPTADLDHVGTLSVDWNCVPDYHVAASPIIHHHARADHSDFARRLASMTSDLEQFIDAHPEAFQPRWRHRLPFPLRRFGRLVMRRVSLLSAQSQDGSGTGIHRRRAG